jgi:transposase
MTRGNGWCGSCARGTGSAVTWRRAQMVLLSAQGMDVADTARVAFTSEDHVRDVIHNFNADGFDSFYPRYRGGHPPKFTLPQRREIKKIAKSSPAEHGLPFPTWSLKLAEFLVAEGVVDDISHEGLRVLLREEGVTFQRLRLGRALLTPSSRRRRPGSSGSTRSPTTRRNRARMSHRSSSASTSSGRSICSRDLVGSGPRSAATRANPGASHVRGCGRRSTAPAGSGTFLPPTTWAATSSTGTSSPARPGHGFWSSARTCARSTHARYASRWSSTISPRT